MNACFSFVASLPNLLLAKKLVDLALQCLSFKIDLQFECVLLKLQNYVGIAQNKQHSHPPVTVVTNYLGRGIVDAP